MESTCRLHLPARGGQHKSTRTYKKQGGIGNSCNQRYASVEIVSQWQNFESELQWPPNTTYLVVRLRITQLFESDVKSPFDGHYAGDDLLLRRHIPSLQNLTIDLSKSIRDIAGTFHHRSPNNDKRTDTDCSSFIVDIVALRC